MNAGHVDLEQARPELPRQELPIPDRVECNAVCNAAAFGYVLALHRRQQIPDINPTHNTTGYRVDASNEICLIHVRPHLTPHPLQLIEHPDGAVCLAHLNCSQHMESVWIQHAESTRAVAHV